MKTRILMGSAIAALTAIGFTATAPAASAAETTPILDSPMYVSDSKNCTPGVTTHIVYKWVPDVTNAGPTMWTVTPADAKTPAKFEWKGAPVAYHRDGTKTSQATDTICAVSATIKAPTFSNVRADDSVSCSVTVPYTPGLETRLYGVNGYPEQNPITSDTTVSAGLDGTFGTAPQFWIGYTANPGYILEGTGTTHIDFYNGDYEADCTA